MTELLSRYNEDVKSLDNHIYEGDDGDYEDDYYQEDDSETTINIADDVAWQAYYRELPKENTASDMADFLGVPLTWVESALNKIAINPQYNSPSRTHFRPMLGQLRTLWLQHSEAGEWHSYEHVEQTTGMDRQWIDARLADTDYTPTVRRNENGDAVDHFPPEATDFLLEYSVVEHYKAHERKVIGYTIDAQNAVGSLRSQLKARRTIAKELRAWGDEADAEQKSELRKEINRLDQRLRYATEKLQKLVDEVDPPITD
jgi:hypothetical protein